MHILGTPKKRPLESPQIPKVALVVFTPDYLLTKGFSDHMYQECCNSIDLIVFSVTSPSILFPIKFHIFSYTPGPLLVRPPILRISL